MNNDIEEEFWQHKSLQEMTRKEWELICDGCGRCCLNKLIDDNTEDLYETSVSCRLLDVDSARCKNYKHRKRIVPSCIKLTPKNLDECLSWLPDSCSYALLARGYDLPSWHPLITKDSDSVSCAGFSVKGKVISEEDVPNPEDWHDYIIRVSD